MNETLLERACAACQHRGLYASLNSRKDLCVVARLAPQLSDQEGSERGNHEPDLCFVRIQEQGLCIQSKCDAEIGAIDRDALHYCCSDPIELAVVADLYFHGSPTQIGNWRIAIHRHPSWDVKRLADLAACAVPISETQWDCIRIKRWEEWQSLGDCGTSRRMPRGLGARFAWYVSDAVEGKRLIFTFALDEAYVVSLEQDALSTE